MVPSPPNSVLIYTQPLRYMAASVPTNPPLLLFLLRLCLLCTLIPLISASTKKVCIVGGGISGSATAHFLRTYSTDETKTSIEIEIFEKESMVGGRMSSIELSEGEFFESGGTILHPKNYHSLRFTELLGLKRLKITDEGNFGIWNGSSFIFVTQSDGTSFFSKKWSDFVNLLSLLWRYKLNLFRMNNYVSETLQKFLRYYDENKPVFYTVEEMLEWAGLYELTQTTALKSLLDHGLSQQLINELITVVVRVNYGQSMSISGMAGAVALCGSGAEFWAVEGGNWKIAHGLIQHSNMSLTLSDEVRSIVATDAGGYELSTISGKSSFCDAVVLATPLDENHIDFWPPIFIPERHSQHTYTTFIRGIINPSYFGLSSVASVPTFIGTMEISTVPFSSINILKSYGDCDKAYKIFSRVPLSDNLLNELFSIRSITKRLDWAAYPHFMAPEKFAPFVLDGEHLYYVNAFENAASTIETGAVAAENVARLLLSRLFENVLEEIVESELHE